MKTKTAMTVALSICVLLAFNLRFFGESVTQAQSSQATFGNEVIGTSGMYFLNYKVASKFQLSEQGTVESISVYFIRLGFNAKAAIYTDSNGKPQTMLSQSNSEYVSSSGWHEFDLPQTQLSPGNYWLSIVSDSINAVGRKVDTGTPQTCMTTNNYPSEFTNPFGTNLWYDSCSVSMYAKYVPSTQPTPTPTPIPTPVPSPTPTPAPQSSPSCTFGERTVENSLVHYFNNYKVASKFQLNEKGIVKSVTAYFETFLFNAKAAVYADSNGSPGNLITQSDSESISSSGWHEFDLPQTQLSPGNYWLSIVSDSINAAGRRVDTVIPQTCTIKSIYPYQFTNPFEATPRYYPFYICLYATYVSLTQPTPTPTPTPTPQLTFGLYSDAACTNKTISISWGNLYPSTTTTQVLYVHNSGNVPITLVKAMSNWNPSNLANYLTLNWDYVNQSLGAGDTLKVTLALTVSAGITGITNFNFETSITAAG